ncbi:MAG TPA: rod-binding protein [Planctomycetaceae bacterium]|nr:rod-binding protein [Planctomycetaceae bacterium]
MAINFSSSAGSSDSRATSLFQRLQNREDFSSKAPRRGQPAVREKFQDFVGGTFYKEMLKALRSGQKHSKYFYGGQAEEMFRGQMDQQIAEDMAHQYAGHLSDPLFEAYSRQSLNRPAGNFSNRAQGARGTEAAHALDALA